MSMQPEREPAEESQNVGTAFASATGDPHHYCWGFDQPPVMTEAQERIVAEIMATSG